MKGLDLTRCYANEVALPLLERGLGSDGLGLLALGSVGDGSDRFGFDDAVSRDHDWGVALCVWTPDGDSDLVARSTEVLLGAPSDYRGAPILAFHEPCPASRAGVMTVGEFYSRFTARPSGPSTALEWDAVPEYALAAATNGEVFYDGPGAFGAVRDRLLAGYPHDVKLKRAAQRCQDFFMAGQMALPRAVARRDHVGAQLAFSRAHDAASLLTHLLAGVFRPYYKWSHVSLARCGGLGARAAAVLDGLADPNGPVSRLDEAAVCDSVDGLALLFIEELALQGLIASRLPSLLDCANELRSKIGDRELLSRPSPLD